jgi:DNA primase
MLGSIDEIKNRLNIVEVVGSYIKLSKTGANFRAVCPFHSEKKPSFFVSPARQIWHCFGCGAHGDIFGFVKQIEGVEFGDALKILAQKAGVELKPLSKESAVWRTERNRLYEICEWAAKFFEKQLEESSVGKEAKKYLLDRGISKESLGAWRIGYAPDVWQGLSDFLTSQGYKREEVAKAGLGLTSEKGSFYDRFRGRIIFPIFDLNSQVVGFGGRVFKEKDKQEIAKYVNTPNTLLYDKSRILYGLDKAKLEIRKKDACVLVEGYTDVIMLSQAGFKNVVATSGIALTPYQLKILKRYSENVFTAFDMDLAGDSATKRGINLAQLQGFNIKVILMPGDKDPADLIAKNPADWEKTMEGAKSIMEFYFESTFSKFDKKTPEGKKAISEILLPPIKRIPNDIEKSFWVQELAKKLEVKEEAVAKEMTKVKLSDEIYGWEPEEIVNLPKKSRKELLEERLLTLILKSPENFTLVSEEDFVLLSPQISQAITCLREKKQLSKLSPELANLINCLSLKAEIEEKEINPQEEFKNCLKEFRQLEIKNKLDRISREIKLAEEEKKSEELEKLIREFNDCSKSLTNLES